MTLLPSIDIEFREFTISYWSWSRKFHTNVIHIEAPTHTYTPQQQITADPGITLLTKTQPNQDPNQLCCFHDSLLSRAQNKILQKCKLNLLGKLKNPRGGLFRWPDEPRRTFLSSRPVRASWRRELVPQRTTREQHESLCCHWLKQKEKQDGNWKRDGKYKHGEN